METRRTKANEILIKVTDYLKDADWTVDHFTFFHIDPITKAMYPTDTAFCIQLGRDMCTYKD